MKQYNVAILGATGAVGQEMLHSLHEYQFPLKSLQLFASKRSAGKQITYRDNVYTIQEANETIFDGIDIVLSAVENDIAEQLLPHAVKAGCLVIDNSSAYRMDPNVPLVIPEINPQDIGSHKGIIANPNCATIIALMAVAPLHQYATISSMVVSTYQAVSGAGVQGIDELQQQTKDVLKGNDVTPSIFSRQIAYNIIPQIGGFDEEGYTSEEMKLVNESRKILHHDDLYVSCTCVRIPVIRSHSESITLTFEKEIDVKKAEALIEQAQGVKLYKDNTYPTPLDTSNQDLVYVGRVRKDLSRNDNKSLTLWCCGDQVRKGAATNAVQIAIAYIKSDN